MNPRLAAVPLLAAIGIGAPALAHAQEPESPAPIVVSAPDARTPAPVSRVPRQTDMPVKAIEEIPTTEASTPGSVVGRTEGKTEVSAQRRGGGGGGGGRPPAAGGSRGPRGGGEGGGRGGAYPVRIRRGAPAGPDWWGPGPVRFVRPYHYDPFWASGAFGWSPMFYAPWSLMWGTAGYGPYPFFGGSTTFDTGGLRLKVRPRDAQVFVNGFYAGIVDDFDGLFQSLRLAPGGHKLEIRMPGYETFTLDVHVQPDRTTTIKETLRVSP